MTTNKKRKLLSEYCDDQKDCSMCPFCNLKCCFTFESDDNPNFMTDAEINAAYAVAFPDNQPQTREEHFRDITTKMAEVYAAKNHDYGDSFARLRERYPTAILIRLGDKLNRLHTLLTGETAQVKDESIDDTLLDLANYAVMELVERKMEKHDNQ